MLHEKSNITVSFRKDLNFKKKWLLKKRFGLNVAKQNTKSNIRTLYNFRRLYTGCSVKEAILLLLSRDTLNFKNKWLLQKHFKWIVRNQNKKIESRHYTFWHCYIHGDPWKNIYSFFFHRVPKIVKINYFCTCSLGSS